jgi:hypothetical protein
MVDLIAKEALLLVDQMAHVNDEEQRRVLGAKQEPQQATDDRRPNQDDEPTSPCRAGAYHLTTIRRKLVSPISALAQEPLLIKRNHGFLIIRGVWEEQDGIGGSAR